CGTTVLSPSLPPPSWSTTRTRSLWTLSLDAARTPLASTGGTTSPAALDTSPAARKSRRVNMGQSYLRWNSGLARIAYQRSVSVWLALKTAAVSAPTTPSRWVRTASTGSGTLPPALTTVWAKLTLPNHAPEDSQPALTGQPATVGGS